MNVKIKCSRCGGSGHVELTGAYADTMAIMDRYRSCGATGAALARNWPGVSATAYNNRLAALERMGLLTSRRYGRQRIFRVVNQTGGKK